MIPAREALRILREGNRRFVAENWSHADRRSGGRRRELVSGQEPLAVVLGCADARVPVEIVFDQGLGDLFVVRVAGNIVTSAQLGSVEFAVQEFGARLVVVLGHTHCGAVLGMVDILEHPRSYLSPHVEVIVDQLRPSVEPVLAAAPGEDRETLVRAAVRANVRASVARLCQGSPYLARGVRSGEIMVVGAEYALETGAVEFFAEAPETP